jgi:hypothetical protein
MKICYYQTTLSALGLVCCLGGALDISPQTGKPQVFLSFRNKDDKGETIQWGSKSKDQDNRPVLGTRSKKRLKV